MPNITQIVTEEMVNMRLDAYVASVTDLSRSHVQKLIENELITVNGKIERAKYKVLLNDVVDVEYEEVTEIDVKPIPMDLNVVYEDEDVIVINKPKGLVVHPGPGNYDYTLVHGLLAHCKDLSGINGVLRPGIVHRIDKDTSGLLMVAKNDVAHESLVNQLVEKTVTRRYVALVHGVIPHDNGTVDAPIGRDPKDRKKMTVVEGGKHAVTHFKVLKRFKDFTLIECRLETGRTHQIRVHMRYIGYPLAGDPQYGPRKTIGAEHGQFLHAKVLGFNHPNTGEYMEFETPIPTYFEEVLENLQK